MAKYMRNAALLAVTVAAAWTPVSAVDDTDVIDAIVARQARLEQVSIEYRQHEETLIEAELPQGAPRGAVADDATREKDCIFVRDGRKLRHEARITEAYHDQIGEADGIHESAVAIYLLTPDGEHLLRRATPDGRPTGIVRSSPIMLPYNLIVDTALGLRIKLGSPARGWMDERALRQAELNELPDNQFELVTTLADGRIRHRWVFDRELGYAPVRYSLRDMNEDFEQLVIECSAFKNVDGLSLPHTIVQTHFKEVDGEARRRNVVTMDVTAYAVGPRAIEPDAMHMDWPPGMRVNVDGAPHRADDNGELVPVRSTGRQSVAPESRSADAQAGMSDAGSRTPWMIIGLGGLCAVVGVALKVTALRRGTGHTSGALVLTGGLILAMCASEDSFALDDEDDNPSQLKLEDVGKLAESQRKAQDARREARQKRVHDYRMGVAERMGARLESDLLLNADQVEACTALLVMHVHNREEIGKRWKRLYMDWMYDYWVERLERRHPTSDVAGRDAWAEITTGVHRDEAYTAAMMRQLSRIQLEHLKPMRREARQALLNDVTSLLSDRQRANWDRAARRLKITIEDGMRPRSEPLVETSVDMLGLLEEACSEGQELEAIAPVIRDPLDHRQTVQRDPRLAPVARILEHFELNYIAALESLDQAWRSVLKARAAGLDDDDPRTLEESREWSAATRAVWNHRIEFANQLAAAAVAEGLIDGQEAAQWEERFFARCCPRVFWFDNIDALVDRLEEHDTLPADLRDGLDEVVAAYNTERLALRLRQARMEITRTWIISDRERYLAKVKEMRRTIRAFELQTYQEMLTTLELRAPEVHQAVAAEPRPVQP